MYPRSGCHFDENAFVALQVAERKPARAGIGSPGAGPPAPAASPAGRLSELVRAGHAVATPASLCQQHNEGALRLPSPRVFMQMSLPRCPLPWPPRLKSHPCQHCLLPSTLPALFFLSTDHHAFY